MKKMFAATMMVLVILMGMIAQAEGSTDVRAWRVGQNEDGKITYYVTYATEFGAFREFEVSQNEFEIAVEVLRVRRLEEERQTKIKEYQSDRGSWVRDAMAWCSFWNSED